MPPRWHIYIYVFKDLALEEKIVRIPHYFANLLPHFGTFRMIVSNLGHTIYVHRILKQNSAIKKGHVGLPWWLSDWESACQCRGHGFKTWSGKVPHAVEQLGPWATTTEPAHLELVLRNKRGRDSERPVPRDEEWPPLAATREGPHTETKTQHSQK